MREIVTTVLIPPSCCMVQPCSSTKACDLDRGIAPRPAVDPGLQGSTGIYNVIYTGLSLKIFKNVIYTERYIYRMASTNFL